MGVEKEKTAVRGALRTNELKWSKRLMDAGWTVIPNVFIERQKAFGLDAVDLNIILHLARHWWSVDELPHPSISTIAAAMGVSRSTVQRRIRQMERDKLIRREARKGSKRGNLTNRYHFDGLIKVAGPYADEALEERQRRQREDAERPTRKGRAKLKVVE